MHPRFSILIGSILSFASVATGAFGAHALKAVMSPQALETYEVAVKYQFYHALALVLVGIYGLVQQNAVTLEALTSGGADGNKNSAIDRAGPAHSDSTNSPTTVAKVGSASWLFLFGIILFSGSLYILSLTQVKAWGAVTPFGGVAFMLGWLSFASTVWKHPSQS